MTVKQYVEFMYFEMPRNKTSVTEVESRDAKIKVPESAFAYRFFERRETVQDGETLVGQAQRYSGIVYVGGQIMTLDDVEREMPSERALISNMQANGYGKVVKCRTGNVQPFNDLEDRVIPEE